MNILQIVSSSRVSGAEKHVVVLSDQLRQRGHQVTTLCPPGQWLPEQLHGAGIPTLQGEMRGVRFWKMLRFVLRFVRENQIDLVHTHLTRATHIGFLTGRITHLPVVTSVHCRTRDFAYRRLFPRPENRIITVSDWIRDSLVQQGVPPSRVRTVYNGTEFCQDEDQRSRAEENVIERAEVAETLPVRAELSVPPEAELVGLFARVEEFKGHPILVQSVRKVVEARPCAYFVCVGPVEPEIQRALWERAAQDGVAERLRFTGARNDVRRLMSAMDVVTLPSRYEACSMAIIEAMALGKPVVATRAGGNPELVQEGETGLLIERTPEALAQALSQVLTDTQMRRRMGEAASQRALSRFSASVMAQNVESLYAELTQAHPRTF